MHLWHCVIICRITYRLSVYISCGEGICQLIVCLKDNRAVWHRGICCSTLGLYRQYLFVGSIFLFTGFLLMKNTEYCESPLILCAISMGCLPSFHFTNQRCALLGRSLLVRHLSLIKITHQYQNLRQAEWKALIKGYWKNLLNPVMAENK